MGHSHRTQGFGPKEVLLALAVIVIGGIIIFLLANKQQGANLVLTESGRMRRLYVALAYYEEQYDSAPAPSLVVAARFDPNQSDYLSEKDPFSGSTPLESQKAKLFPSDPGLDNHEYSPFRISFSYILNFIRADKIAVNPWYETRQDPRIGELADEWLGNVDPGTSFQAKVSGRVLRIGTDGAVYQLRDRGGPKPLGNANDLFIKR